jgi:glutamyl-Q tRNA(Asp) synthetase
MPPIVRFAPSPTGRLHIGNIRPAILNWLFARRNGGSFLLRLDDTDRVRSHEEHAVAIREDLAWLGVDWEEPVRRQSECFDDYRAALARLEAQGLIYASFESRAEIARMVAERGADWPRDPDGAPLYPGSALSLADAEREKRMQSGEPFALRLDMARAVTRAGRLSFIETDAAGTPTTIAADPTRWGDVVLARKEVPTSYHLAVVVDDALQGVTHVVRGQDLFAATAVHALLQHLLGLPAPSYHHHRLILNAEGRKLSKSTRATALRALRAAGLSAADIRKTVGLA